MWPNPFFVKINTPWKKVAQEFMLRLQFSKICTQKKNWPIGENLPNLVTLIFHCEQSINHA
jgi:hypothetical protein